MKRIAVIGCGSWGTALAVTLTKHGHMVKLWARNAETVAELNERHTNEKYLKGVVLPEMLTATTDRAEVMKDAEIVISAVPSRAVRQTMMDFAHYVKDGMVVVNVAKGLEDGSLLRLSQVIEECLPQCKVCTLSGPSHAEEVIKDIPTTCLIACKDEQVACMVQQEFMNPRFRLYTNTDIIGVEIGAALKNVIALAAGINDGLGFGDNSKAALMTRGMAEMKRLGVAMGAQSETFAGLSGIGDLIVTCTSMHSRNRRAGILLGQGKTLQETLNEIKMVVEGVHTVQAACKLAEEYHVDLPITKAVSDILFADKPAMEAVLELMTRDSKPE